VLVGWMGFLIFEVLRDSAECSSGYSERNSSKYLGRRDFSMGTEQRRTMLVGVGVRRKKLVGVGAMRKKPVGVGVLETYFGGFVLVSNGNVGKIGGKVESCPNGRM